MTTQEELQGIYVYVIKGLIVLYIAKKMLTIN